MHGLLRCTFITLILFHVIKYAHCLYNTSEKDRRGKTGLTPMYHKKYLKCPHKICTHSKDYPEKEINETLTNKDKLEGLFGQLLNSALHPQPIIYISRIGAGNYTHYHHKKLCKSETPMTIVPRVMRNHKEEWKFIVNNGEIRQSFVSEFCSTSNGVPNLSEKCYEFDEAACKQGFQENFLLTFHNGTLDFDLFMIPTTCKCDSCK